MGMKVNISSVEMKDAVIHTFTDAKGYTNSYVLKSATSKRKTTKQKTGCLNNIELKNVTVIIEDAITNKRYQGNN